MSYYAMRREIFAKIEEKIAQNDVLNLISLKRSLILRYGITEKMIDTYLNLLEKDDLIKKIGTEIIKTGTFLANSGLSDGHLSVLKAEINDSEGENSDEIEENDEKTEENEDDTDKKA